MEHIYAFDVDGTLTKPREVIDPAFSLFFRNFAAHHPAYLVTGSDRPKILEQLPLETMNTCIGTFTCSGAEFWTGEDLVYRKEHKFPDGLIKAVEHFIDTSPYRNRYGNHIEPRPGMLNISVVGRNATLGQRKMYHAWDTANQERTAFVKALIEEFPEYEASTGGEISIDIVPRGWTKAVAKSEIEQRHPGCAITFFGDKMQEGGNDKPLADALKAGARHAAIAVAGYEETWRVLKHATSVKAA